MSNTIHDKITDLLYDINENMETLSYAANELAEQLEIEIPKEKMSETLIEYMERVLKLTDEGYMNHE